jgi:hypothetical protein
MRNHSLTHTAALGLAVAALAAPAAAAQQQDLRSPDARDAAHPVPAVAVERQDLRSPDARDAAHPVPAVAVEQQDLRSPDTRDLAAGRGTFSAPDVVVVKMPQSSPAADGGIEWGDAGIGAAVLLGLIAVGLGGSLALVHRRRHPAPTA